MALCLVAFAAKGILEARRMNILTVSNLRDLVGGWSCLVLALGLAGAIISYLSWRRKIEWVEGEPAKVMDWWGTGMLILTLYVASPKFGLSHSRPPPGWNRDELSYDTQFASLIGLTFSVALAGDAYRFRRLQRKTQPETRTSISVPRSFEALMGPLRRIFHKSFWQGWRPLPRKRCPVCKGGILFRKTGGSTAEGGRWDGIETICPMCGKDTIDDPWMPDNDNPEREVAPDQKGWVMCPFCGFRFKPTDRGAFRDGHHRRCGQRLVVET